MERRAYELSPEQEAFLRQAIMNPPIAIPGQEKRSAQIAAQAAWERIAEELSFDLDTIQLLDDDPNDIRHFTAVPLGGET